MARPIAQSAPMAPPASRGFWKKLRLFLFVAFVLVVFLAGIAAFTLLGMVQRYQQMLPPVNDLKARAQASGTRIYAHDGQLLAEFSAEHREWVGLRDIPDVLKKATIAIEDERFYLHKGADPIGLARALWQNARHRQLRQGGSTIPEQLAKLIYLSERMYERSLDRRLTQMLLALEIEKRYTKEEILEMYLNKVYYGCGAYGVRAAAKLYFAKELPQVTASEAAMIAAITKSPEKYSPFEEPQAAHQQNALGRRNLVLAKMAEQGMLNEYEYEEAKSTTLSLAPRRLFGNRHFRAAHFAMYVKKLLNEKYSDEELRTGGFHVYTTLDMDMQREATRAIRTGLQNAEGRNASQAALVCLDPRTGHIHAMVGGRDFYDRVPEHHGQLNRTVQSRRQPGSSFKIYVYTAALEILQKTPDSTVLDSPVSILSGGKNWSPKNYDGKYGGTMTYRSAFKFSRNVPAVKIAREVGIDEVIRTARLMGIRSRLNPYLPVALGADGLTMLEHTSAVGVIVADGARAEPTPIERIVRSNGEVVWSHPHPVELRKVISKSTAAYMQELMHGVVESGTGTRARIQDVAVGGKTGTTNKHADVWFVGFTPDLVATVWMGNDNMNVPMYKGTTGGHMAAPIWKSFMEKAHVIFQERKAANPNLFLPPPDETTEATDGEAETPPEKQQVVLRICAESGLLARTGCAEVRRQKFDSEDRPTDKCDLHDELPTTVDVRICQESGQLANEHCQYVLTEHMERAEAPKQKCDLHAAKPKPPDPGDPPPTVPPTLGM